jgi:hypothetical protein
MGVRQAGGGRCMPTRGGCGPAVYWLHSTGWLVGRCSGGGGGDGVWNLPGSTHTHRAQKIISNLKCLLKGKLPGVAVG